MAIFWQVAFSEMQHRSFSMDHVYSVNRIRKYKSSCNFIRALCSYIIAFRLGDREWRQIRILMAWQIASANKAIKWDISCIWQQTLMEPRWISAQKLIFKQRKSNLYKFFYDVWLVFCSLASLASPFFEHSSDQEPGTGYLSIEISFLSYVFMRT